ncbi:hypothetical protein D3C78_1551640 [compost metagenome]
MQRFAIELDELGMLEARELSVGGQDEIGVIALVYTVALDGIDLDTDLHGECPRMEV